jgi:HSP20 family molecular chaperone IbpA
MNTFWQKVKNQVTVERTLLTGILFLQLLILHQAYTPSGTTPPGAVPRGGDDAPVSARRAEAAPTGDVKRRQVTVPLPRHMPFAPGDDGGLVDGPYSMARPARLFDFERFFEEAFSRFEHLDRLVQELDEGWHKVGPSPAMDMRETSDLYSVSLSMRDIDPDALSVSLRGQMLTVRFRETVDNAVDGSGRALMTRIWLPGPVQDGTHANASYTNGVLKISVPKALRANMTSSPTR